MITLWRDGDWSGLPINKLYDILKTIDAAFQDRIMDSNPVLGHEDTRWTNVPLPDPSLPIAHVGPSGFVGIMQGAKPYYNECVARLKDICTREIPEDLDEWPTWTLAGQFADALLPIWLQEENGTDVVTEEFLGIQNLTTGAMPVNSLTPWKVILEALSRLQYFVKKGVLAEGSSDGIKWSAQDDLVQEWLGYATYDAAKAKMDEVDAADADYIAATNQSGYISITPVQAPTPPFMKPTISIGGYRQGSWRNRIDLYNDGGLKHKVSRAKLEYVTVNGTVLYTRLDLSWPEEPSIATGAHGIWEKVTGHEGGPPLIESNIGDIEDGAEFDLFDTSVEHIEAEFDTPMDVVRGVDGDDLGRITPANFRTDISAGAWSADPVSNFFKLAKGWTWFDAGPLYDTGS